MPVSESGCKWSRQNIEEMGMFYLSLPFGHSPYSPLFSLLAFSISSLPPSLPFPSRIGLVAGFLCVFLCVFYLPRASLVYFVFFLFLVYFLLYVLSCQYQCK